MRTLVKVLIVALAVCWFTPQGVSAQVVTPPWPDGCSVGLPGWAQQGLDSIFNGACDNHDRCWAQCNGARGPFRGLGHRNQCDQTFLSELTAACAIRAGQAIFPLGDIDNVGEFLATCEGLALVMTSAVQSPFGTSIYWRSQCLRGCNPMACMQAGLFFPTPDGRPPTCGKPPYVGPGVCYRQPYTVDACAFHTCPSFLSSVEQDDGKAAVLDFMSNPTGDDEKPTTQPKTENDEGALIGVECNSVLDWFCCGCQICPNCLM